MSTKLQKEYVKEYALAGNATITLQSGVTGAYFTYKIVKHKENDNVFFVRLLSGPNNDEDYQYIGCYFKDTEYFNAAKPWKDRVIAAWPKSLRAIKWFFENLDDVPNNLLVYHEGRCGRCGRKLTTPESIERGLGPECQKKM